MAEQFFNPQPIQSTTNNNSQRRFNGSNNYRGRNGGNRYSNYKRNNNYNYNNRDDSRFHYVSDSNVNQDDNSAQKKDNYDSKKQNNNNNKFYWSPDQSNDQTPQQNETQPVQQSPPQQQPQQQQSPPPQQPQQQQSQGAPQQPPSLNQKHNALNITSGRNQNDYNQKRGGFQNRRQNSNRGGYSKPPYNNNNRFNDNNGNKNNYNNQYNNNRNNRSNNQYDNKNNRPRNNSNKYQQNANNYQQNANNYQQNPNNYQQNNNYQQYPNDASNLKKILCIMSDEVTSSMPIEDVLKMDNLGADLIENPPYDGKVLSESLSPMNVPMNLVDLLVEGLAVDQPEELRFLANKTFPKLTVLTINLPVRTPISFLTPDQPDKTQLGFFETNSLSSERSQTLTADVLNTMASRQKIVYKISNVKKNSFSNQELSEFTKECEVVVLKDNIVLNGNLISFDLHVLQYDFTQEKQDKINKFIGKMYQAGQDQNSQIGFDEKPVYMF